MERSSFSSRRYSSGGTSADLGMPGESMACLPSTSTCCTSAAFFFLPSVPILSQKLSCLTSEPGPGLALARPPTPGHYVIIMGHIIYQNRLWLYNRIIQISNISTNVNQLGKFLRNNRIDPEHYL